MRAQHLAFVIVLAAACGLAASADAMTLRKFQELDAAADKPEATAALDMYLRGIYEGVVAINADAEKREGRPLFCMPRSVGVAPINIRDMMKKRTARLRRSLSSGEYEALFDSELGLFVLDGMREGFPCG
jgi:hypothetical protein